MQANAKPVPRTSAEWMRSCCLHRSAYSSRSALPRSALLALTMCSALRTGLPLPPASVTHSSSLPCSPPTTTKGDSLCSAVGVFANDYNKNMLVLVPCSLPFMFQTLPILRRASGSDQTLLSPGQRPLLQNQISLHLTVRCPEHLPDDSQTENAVQVRKHQMPGEKLCT